MMWLSWLRSIYLVPFVIHLAGTASYEDYDDVGAVTEWIITCYTCRNASSNSNCNSGAIDRPCPTGTDYCQSVHLMDELGRSVEVTKQCAKAEQCTLSHVGCGPGKGPSNWMCVACCDMQYCNEFVPTNQSTAILITTRTNSVSSIKSSLVLCFVLFAVSWRSKFANNYFS